VININKSKPENTFLLGSNLVLNAIEAMVNDGADEVSLLSQLFNMNLIISIKYTRDGQHKYIP